MGDRLAGKTAIVVGAGQTPGETIGNGRATAILFAREGAQVLLVDRDGDSVAGDARLIEPRGAGRGHVLRRRHRRRRPTCHALVDAVRSIAFGPHRRPAQQRRHRRRRRRRRHRSTEDAWDRIIDVNLKAMLLTCKHVLPVMREQRQRRDREHLVDRGRSRGADPHAYKISKAGVNALTQSARADATRATASGANAIMPGLDGHADGDRRDRARSDGMPRERCRRGAGTHGAARPRRARRGTSPTPRCSSRRTRPSSSPASCCRSTAARARRSADADAGSDGPGVPISVVPAHQKPGGGGAQA